MLYKNMTFKILWEYIFNTTIYEAFPQPEKQFITVVLNLIRSQLCSFFVFLPQGYEITSGQSTCKS